MVLEGKNKMTRRYTCYTGLLYHYTLFSFVFDKLKWGKAKTSPGTH